MTFIAPVKFAIDLLAVLLLALGIKGLSKVRSAREANRLACIAMMLAAFGVLLNSQGTIGISINSWIWIICGTLIGGLLGALTAKRVPMTAMPEIVALFNGCVEGCHRYWSHLAWHCSHPQTDLMALWMNLLGIFQ